MKKVLALVLAFAMLFSTITVAFADSVGPEAEALAKIGVLKGEDGVTVEYLAKAPTRLQAAIMLLRLKGLEEEAKKFESEDNFADVKDYAWAEGKNMMAYLKANPAVGFKGTDKGFEPNREITAIEFYKVLLVSLGYVESDAEVVGDFTWDTLKEKLEEVGLGKVLDSESFTNNDMAVATVEALGMKLKDSNKTLLAKLVEEGVVNEDAAVAAGLIKEEEPAKPVVEDKIAPKVVKVETTGNNVVTVTFDRDIEKASGEDVANYSIKSTTGKVLVVNKATVNGKLVVLETEGMENYRVYNVTISNVKNASGVVMATRYTGTFKGIIDTKAPLLSRVTVKNNIRIRLLFNEELDKTTAETIENYAIEGLTVEKATLMKDDFGKATIVELITSPQKTSTKYTVKVNNVEDKFGNALAKEATATFWGMKAETNVPTIDFANTKPYEGNYFIVSFKDDNRIDHETAGDPANYTFTGDLAVESVEVMDPEDLDCKMVLIRTSEMEKNKSYQLKVANVMDELGNVMKPATISFAGKGEDIVPPYVKLVEAKASDSIKVTFDSFVDVEVAENVENYSIEGLAIISATLDKIDRNIVTLKTSTQESNKKYTLSITGMTDLAGNVAATLKSTVYGYNTETDATEPVVEYIQVVGNRNDNNPTAGTEVRVYFNKPVIVVGDPVITLAQIGNDGNATATTVTAKFVGGTGGTSLGYDSKYVDGKAYGGYMDDGKVLQFVTTQKLSDVESYRLVAVEKTASNYIKDFYGNIVAFETNTDKINELAIDAPGTDADNERATIESIVQKDVKMIEITFTKNVKVTTASINGLTVSQPNNKHIVRLTSGSALALGKEFDFDFSAVVVDYLGDRVLDYNDAYDGSDFSGKSKFEVALEDKEAPNMIDAWADDNLTIIAKFDEELGIRGSYTLTYVNDQGTTRSLAVTVVDWYTNSDGTYEVVLEPSSKLESKYVYTLKVAGARDVAGNVAATSTFDFVGSDIVANSAGITNVLVLNGSTAHVYFGAGNKPITSVTEIYKDSNNKDVKYMVFDIDTNAQAPADYANYKNIREITLDVANNPHMFFYGDGIFEVKAGTQTYKFTSTLSTAGINIASDGLLTYSDMKTGDEVYVYNYETFAVVTNYVNADTKTITADDKGVELDPAALANDTYYLVKVVRNGVIKYAAKVKVYK